MSPRASVGRRISLLTPTRWFTLGLPRRGARALAATAGLACAAFLATVAWISWPLPAKLVDPDPVPALNLEDRHGLLLRSTRAPDGSRGGWIPLAEIDPDIVRAFLAMEDERFYRHPGVDLKAVARALRDNLRARRVVSGASTISMQTARLLLDLPRSWPGKLRQALWALRLEAHLEKNTILETYLNRIPLGQGTAGVAAAASLYFDASASDVSLAQAALLAALVHAPSRDNPLVSRGRAAKRRALVLRRLQALGYTGREATERAKGEPLITRRSGAPFHAPHFTTRVLSWEETDGNVVHGVRRTSLDLGLQTALEAEVRHTVEVLRDRRAEHAAAVVLDNRSGAILAWVGSPDFWADTAGQVDMVVSLRQPGSALKPFLYGLAFDRGFTAASILPDLPRAYDTPTGTYRPRNYDRRFRGPVRVREALASSYNVPAVELANRLGPGALLATLRQAGFAELEASSDHYGLGLALGNGDVTLLGLANAYRALVAGGLWRPYRWLAPIPNRRLVREPQERRVMSPLAAYLVLNILSDPTARIPGFGVDTPFDWPFPVAAKTGTSRRFTDNWAVAVTEAFTVAVWVGNFSGRPMAGVSGISGAGPLLHRAVLQTAKLYPPGLLPSPSDVGAIPVEVCRLSGGLAHRWCPRMVEWFSPGSEPTRACDWHRGHDTVIPPEYAEWLDIQLSDAGAAPAAVAAGVGEVTAPPERTFRIVSPQDGDRYSRPPNTDPRYASIALRAVGGGVGLGGVGLGGDGDHEPVRWWVDGVEWTARRWRLQTGVHTIRAEAADGRWDEVRIVVE